MILYGKFSAGQYHGSYLLQLDWGMRFMSLEKPPGLGSPEYLGISVLLQPGSKMVRQGIGLFLLF